MPLYTKDYKYKHKTTLTGEVRSKDTYLLTQGAKVHNQLTGGYYGKITSTEVYPPGAIVTGALLKAAIYQDKYLTPTIRVTIPEVLNLTTGTLCNIEAESTYSSDTLTYTILKEDVTGGYKEEVAFLLTCLTPEQAVLLLDRYLVTSMQYHIVKLITEGVVFKWNTKTH